jgi:hypothetical protein
VLFLVAMKTQKLTGELPGELAEDAEIEIHIFG